MSELSLAVDKVFLRSTVKSVLKCAEPTVA